MAEHKPTTDRRQALTFLGLAGLAVAFFGYAILPLLDPVKSPLMNSPAPDFTLGIIAGGEPGSRWALSDHRGKVVILDFWASWCAPCRVQAPVVERIAQRFPDVEVVGVNTSDDMSDAMAFLRSNPTTYVSVFDGQGAVAGAYRATALPTLVVVDASGNVSAFEQRALKEDRIVALIEAARGK